MDPFDFAERNVLAALFIDSHRPGDRLLDVDELAHSYHVHVSERWFAAIVADLKARGIVMTFADKESSSAVLIDGGYKAARRQLLDHLGATNFQVDWKKQEILTDVDCPEGFPMAVGWKWRQYAGEKPNPAPKPEPRPLFEGTAESIPWEAQVASPEVIAGIPFPLLRAAPVPPERIHWTKWGTIFGGIGVLLTLAALLIALL